MLQRVKKLGSKLFGDNPDKPDDASDGQLRTGSKVAPMAGSFLSKFPSARKSADVDMDACGSFSKSSGMIGVHPHASQDQPSSSFSKGSVSPLPPVQVSNNSGTSQNSNGYHSGAPSPTARHVASIMPATGGSGRRKSTPAALDMALKTAEGKAAIEELISSAGKKQMVFGQYFGNAAKPPSGAQSGPLGLNSRFGRTAAALSPMGSGSYMPPVGEDHDMSDVVPINLHPNSTSPSHSKPSSSSQQPAHHQHAQHAAHHSPMAWGSSGSSGPSHLSQGSLYAHTPQHMQHVPTSPQQQQQLQHSVDQNHGGQYALPGALPAALPAALPNVAAESPDTGMELLAPPGMIQHAAGAANNTPLKSAVSMSQKRPAESPPTPSNLPMTKQPVLHMPASVAAPASLTNSALPSPISAPSSAPHHAVPMSAAAMHAALHAVEIPPAKPTRILAMASQLPVNMARKYWQLADYSIIRKMYTGYASTVYQATCKKSLEQVALKVYHMENLCELNHYQVLREIRVHSSLSHQHIIQLFCAFQEGNDVVMVQEYAECGDLYKLLHKNGGRLSERQAVEMVLHPFLLALHYLHTKGIMHRDIKPENVLFTDQRILKLADFGLAIDLTEEKAVTRAGTLDYMAPEVLRCPPKNLPQENKNNAALHYNNSVDAWAVGVFAYELIVGTPPFAGDSQLASVDKICNATPQFPDKLSELAKSFISGALKKVASERPSVLEMLHHPWIRSYQRRTSVRIPQVIRRRSVQPGGMMPGMPEEGGPVNMDNMTPEEIERMIQRLQMARNAADIPGL